MWNLYILSQSFTAHQQQKSSAKALQRYVGRTSGLHLKTVSFCLPL